MSKESGAVWRRVGDPKEGFTYLTADGTPIRSKGVLARIRSLAIPPAWTDVEIAASPQAKVQATGHDSEGRKQYIYHPKQVERRQRKKYRKLLGLAQDLPRIRQATAEHLKQKGVGRERVLATIVRLMLRGYFRVGSERYAEENKTFGIATLQKRHLQIEGDDLVFRYSGKHSIEQRTVVADTPLVEVMKEILELPGRRLFRYRDEDGKVKNVTARDVNAYIKEVGGEGYSAKDLRTWGGTVRAAAILADLGPAQSRKEAEKAVVLACKLVSAELGNTPAVCRSSYIHPVVLEKYLTGKTIEPMMRRKSRSRKRAAPPTYYPEEAALMRFLDRWG